MSADSSYLFDDEPSFDCSFCIDLDKMLLKLEMPSGFESFDYRCSMFTSILPVLVEALRVALLDLNCDASEQMVDVPYKAIDGSVCTITDREGMPKKEESLASLCRESEMWKVSGNDVYKLFYELGFVTDKIFDRFKSLIVALHEQSELEAIDE